MITLQELEERLVQLEKNIANAVATEAKATEARLRTELHIIQLAIAGLKAT